MTYIPFNNIFVYILKNKCSLYYNKDVGNFLTPVILVILFATLCLLAYTVYVLKRNMNAMKENMLEHSMILQRVLTNGGGTETQQRQNNENVDTELNNKIVVSDNDSDSSDSDSSDSDSSDSDSSATESDDENEDEENNEMLSKKITLDGGLEENNVKQEDDESDDESDSEQDDDDDDTHGLMNIANHLNVSSESDALNLETVVVKKNNSDNTLEKQIKEKLYEDATYDLGPLTLDDSIDVETDETMTLNKKEETNDSSDSDSSDSDSSDSDSDSDDENLNTVTVSETKDTEKMIQMPLNEQSDTLMVYKIATNFKKLKVSVLREMVYSKISRIKNKAKKLKKKNLLIY